jgi:hypothetical protein
LSAEQGVVVNETFPMTAAEEPTGGTEVKEIPGGVVT